MQASRHAAGWASLWRGSRGGFQGGAVLGLLVAAGGSLTGCRGADPGGRSGSGPSLAVVEGGVTSPEDGSSRTGSLRRLGERVEAREFALTVGAVKECPPPYLKEGNTVLGVELLIEGLVERDVHVNPFYAQIADADGLLYRPTLQGCEPRLRAARLGQGERARGFVSFELSKRARRLELRYEPASHGGERQLVGVDLER